MNLLLTAFCFFNPPSVGSKLLINPFIEFLASAIIFLSSRISASFLCDFVHSAQMISFIIYFLDNTIWMSDDHLDHPYVCFYYLFGLLFLKSIFLFLWFLIEYRMFCVKIFKGFKHLPSSYFGSRSPSIRIWDEMGWDFSYWCLIQNWFTIVPRMSLLWFQLRS